MLSDRELVEEFRAGRMPEGGFHHPEHVRVAWLYLQEKPPLEALQLFVTDLRAFAQAQGKPDLYHETITLAYFFLINERSELCQAHSWQEFALKNSDLVDGETRILSQYYSSALLESGLARKIFILPRWTPEAPDKRVD